MSFWHLLKSILGFSLNGSRDADLEILEHVIGYHFRNDSLLLLGLSHRSHARTLGQDQPSNERLEFLGDSVLGLIIADQLYRDHPEELEGNLTKTKAMLVNETTLSTIARELGLNAFVRLSPEEERSGGRERSSIISDAFESIIGAVYLDGGLDAARDVVLRLIYTRKGRIVTDSAQRNYKGDLLELMQARGDTVPRYDVIQEEGPDHEKTFHVVVSVGGQKIGEGSGLSKKEAEQRAACRALEQLAPQS